MKHVLILLALMIMPVPLHAQNLTILEFFAANGCKDSAPAHDIIQKIHDQDNQDIMLLTCHVTHFRNEENPEELGLKVCDKRHAAYFSNGALNSVQVPSIVMNGHYTILNDNILAAKEKLNIAKNNDQMMHIDLDLTEHDLTINLPEFDMITPADLWIIGYQNQAIDDSGKTYINLVKYIQKLEPWNGQKTKRTYDISEISDMDRIAILAQRSLQREIFGIGKIEP